jgi:Fe-S cluster assembly protein SufD
MVSDNVSAFTPATSEAGGAWVKAALKEAQALRKGWGVSQLDEVIGSAVQVWERVLFPTPRSEDWKYTNPEKIAQGVFSVAPGGKGVELSAQELNDKVGIAGLETFKIVFVNGQFSQALSSDILGKGRVAGLTVGVVTQAAQGEEGEVLSAIGSLGAHKTEPFAALATALMTDAVVIEVAAGIHIERPIQIVSICTEGATGMVVTPRVYVRAAQGASVRVIDSHTGSHGVQYLSLPMTEMRVEAGAAIDYYKFQDESNTAFHVSTTTIEQERDARVSTHIFSFGGKLVRNNVYVALQGAGGHSVLNGLSVLGGEQHVDNTTHVHHVEPHCESREHFKGVYAGASKGVFSGTITVEKIAQKTNAFQSNQALLLSSEASIDSRPQLKIWADDVKCTHGATVGQLDADAMFYLRSRGIDLATARSLLVHAFASDVLRGVSSEPVRLYVEEHLGRKLEAVSNRAA